LYLSADATITAGDVFLGSFPVPALAPGGASGRSLTATIPAGTAAGSYHVGVVAGPIAGESNLFDVHVGSVNDGIAYLLDSQGDLLQARHPDLRVGQYAQLMLRPEQFHLQCPGEGFAALEGRLEQLLFIGKDFELLLRTGHGRLVKAVLRDAAPQRLRTGDSVQLWYGLQAAHLIPGGA
jgi:spermidine/putrescine transport system ATP-binding protein